MTIFWNLAKIIGIFQGTLFNYVIGLVSSLVFLFISKEAVQISNLQLKSIPLWAYLGGILVLCGLTYNLFLDKKQV